MKKLLHLKLMAVLLALALGFSNSWAGEETFKLTSAAEVTSNGITVKFAKGSGSTAPTWYNAGLRLYPSNTVTISSESDDITKIEFTWEKQGQKDFITKVTATPGDYTHPSEAGTGTWEGKAKSVVFTLNGSGQLQLNTLKVTAGAADTRIDPEFAYSAPAFKYWYGDEEKDHTLPTLSYVDGFNEQINYESDNELVTVDNTGLVTVNEPSAETVVTIKASFDGNEVYKASEASYVLTVTKHQATTFEYRIDGTKTESVDVEFNSTTYTLPTLNIPSGFSVTYDSSNKDIATVDENGVVTLNTSIIGTAEISAVGEKVGYYNAEAAYTINITPTNPTLAFEDGQESYLLDISEKDAFVAPKATTNSDATITYESSNEAVATVNAQGDVTILKLGKTTITASVAQTASYNTKSVSYDIVVTDRTNCFEMVTDVNQLKEGDKIILVGYGQNKNGAKVSVLSGIANNLGTCTNILDNNKANGTLELPESISDPNIYIITLGKSGDNWTLQNEDGKYLRSCKTTKNQLEASEFAADYSEATITIASNKAQIVFNSGYINSGSICSHLTYNYNNRLDRFSCYAAEQGSSKMYIYKKLATKGHYTIHHSLLPENAPDNHIYTDASGVYEANNVTMTDETGHVFDKPLLAYGTLSYSRTVSNGAVWHAYYMPYEVADWSTVADDAIEYTGATYDNGTITVDFTKLADSAKLEADHVYLIIPKDGEYSVNVTEAAVNAVAVADHSTSYTANGYTITLIGNYTAKEDLYSQKALALSGGNFKGVNAGATLKPFRAYMLIEKGGAASAPASVRMRVIGGNGETTAIEELEVENESNDAVYYNIQGVRVANPTNGIYVNDGKKVYVK